MPSGILRTLAVTSILALTIACSDGGEITPGQGGAEPQTISSSGRPATVAPAPDAWLLTSSGQQSAGGVGSRCWDGACLEYAGPVTNAQPIVLTAAQSFNLNFEAGAPLQTSSAWVRVEDGSPASNADGIVWQRLLYQLSKDEPGQPAPQLEPGSYVYVVHGIWQGRGDIVYAFLVDKR